jgi:response regulator RpfG family c-di-GMP phosphodiesterase
VRAGAPGARGGGGLSYVPIPVALLAVGHPIPVNVWSDTGQLLLRKGQSVVSEQHRDKLHAFNACSTSADAHAWQRAYERMVHEWLRDGVDLMTIARAPMPSEIREADYIVGAQLTGGWLDLQEVLRGILYQGGLAISPLERLDGIARKAASLLEQDTDDSLFSLFQALADDKLGYCATHALLCGVVCTLTATKLGLDAPQRRSLLDAALIMNIGMARDQDSLARQTTPPTDWQRELIRDHAQYSAEILQNLGLDDPDTLDLVRWHHQPDSPDALPRNPLARRILATADAFVAKMAARKTRSPLSALGAAKSIYVGAEGHGHWLLPAGQLCAIGQWRCRSGGAARCQGEPAVGGQRARQQQHAHQPLPGARSRGRRRRDCCASELRDRAGGDQPRQGAPRARAHSRQSLVRPEPHAVLGRCQSLSPSNHTTLSKPSPAAAARPAAGIGANLNRPCSHGTYTASRVSDSATPQTTHSVGLGVPTERHRGR